MNDYALRRIGRRVRACWPVLGLLMGCAPYEQATDDTGSASTTALVASTTEVLPTSGTSGSTGTLMSTSASTGDTGTIDFIKPKDVHGESCSIFTQDCPEGMKCNPYADDGGGSWNNDKCVPVVDDPKQLGESCIAPEGGVGGVDDCDLGLMCWDTDAENQGTCIELCGGSQGMGTCKAPKTTCASYDGGTLALCLPACNPVTQDCDPSDVCIENPTGEGFLCVLDASGDEGQAHDPCLYGNSCDPGLQCVPSTWAVECDPMQEMCCEPFCDITLPNACPGEGQQCNAYFAEGTAPPGCENVGFCRVPM